MGDANRIGRGAKDLADSLNLSRSALQAVLSRKT